MTIFFSLDTVKHHTDHHTAGLTIHGQVSIAHFILSIRNFWLSFFSFINLCYWFFFVGTGHKRVPQPDNAEYDINRTPEACLSVLNNVYNDGIWWHDVACYHVREFYYLFFTLFISILLQNTVNITILFPLQEKPVVCEDNPELINYVGK